MSHTDLLTTCLALSAVLGLCGWGLAWSYRRENRALRRHIVRSHLRDIYGRGGRDA